MSRPTGKDRYKEIQSQFAAQQTPAAPEPERIPRPGLPNNNIYDRAADWQPGYAQGSQAQDSTVEMLSLDPKIKRIIKRVNDLGYGAAITPQGIRYGGQIMSFEHWDLKVKG